VLWSTGENHRIYSVSVSGGTPQLIAIDANYLPTMLATDGTFVYWVQNDGPEVRRALLDGGSGSGGASAGQLVSQVPNGTAGWGRLVVRDGLVFWVTSDYPAGVWLANADGTSPNVIEVAITQSSRGIAVDDEYVYWSDTTPGVIQRLKRTDIGSAVTPDTVASGENQPTDLAVDETHIYWLGYSTVRAAPKQGGTATDLAVSQYQPWEIALDDTFVYWTDQAPGATGAVRKVAKGGGTNFDVVTVENEPAGLAQNCDTLFYVNFGTSIISLVSK